MPEKCLQGKKKSLFLLFKFTFTFRFTSIKVILIENLVFHKENFM